MSLRIITIIFLGVAFVLTLLLTRLFLENSLIHEFRQYESDLLDRNITTVLNALNSNIDDLDANCDDWAGWDDTWEWIVEGGPEYIESNLVDDTFETLNLNLIVYINPSCEVAWSRLYPDSSAPGWDVLSDPLPETLEYILQHRGLIEHPGTDSMYAGLANVNGFPILLSSRPITRSDESGPVRGSLIFGRYVGEGLEESISELTGLETTFTPVLPEQLRRGDFVEVMAAHLHGQNFTEIIQDEYAEEKIRVTDYLEDLDGNPGLLVAVTDSRQFYRQGIGFGRRIFVSLMVFMAAISLMGILMLERFILRPISELDDKVRSVAVSSDQDSAVLKMRGTELTLLKREFDRMLTRLEESRKKVEEHQARLRSLASEITYSEARERDRIARGIHDGIGPRLAMLKFKLSALREAINDEQAAFQFEEIMLDLREVLQESRTLTFELNPPILFDLGLDKALDWLCETRSERDGLSIAYHGSDSDLKLSEDLSILLFSAARELITNAIKHAGGGEIDVRFSTMDSFVALSVSDNGPGFDPSELDVESHKKHAFGLFSLRERLQSHGGELIIESGDGRGSKVTVKSPMFESREDGDAG